MVLVPVFTRDTRQARKAAGVNTGAPTSRSAARATAASLSRPSASGRAKQQLMGSGSEAKDAVARNRLEALQSTSSGVGFLFS